MNTHAEAAHVVNPTGFSKQRLDPLAKHPLVVFLTSTECLMDPVCHRKRLRRSQVLYITFRVLTHSIRCIALLDDIEPPVLEDLLDVDLSASLLSLSAAWSLSMRWTASSSR